jgi:hypothetical protein
MVTKAELEVTKKAESEVIKAELQELEAENTAIKKELEKAKKELEDQKKGIDKYLLIAGTNALFQNSNLVSMSLIFYFASILRGVERTCRHHCMAEFASFL